MTGPPRVRFVADGIEVENGLLWLDARKPKTFGVVTHAHADHLGRHRSILCTPETAAFARKRIGPNPDYVERRYGEKTTVGDLEVTLLCAGHILGSAMVLVEGPHGSLLYTGDARPSGGLTCPPAQPVHADVLVTEATFGRPRFRLPDPEQVRAEMVAFAQAALARNETPVFLAYALGKAQEVMTALAAAGIPIAAHGTVWAMCDVYRAFGFTWPGSRRLRGKGGRQAAIVVPPRWVGVSEVKRAAPLRIAAVTGWGAKAVAGGIERCFELSDHADYDGLLEIVERVRPAKVHVLHGYAEEFAADLREKGYDAEAVPGHSGPADDAPPGMFGRP